MRRILPVIAIFAVVFSSCNKEAQPLSKAEITRTIDSIVAARTREADQQSALDLERRIKIEVKVKADSIVSAYFRKLNGDTLVQKPAPAARPTIMPHGAPAGIIPVRNK
jgi:hypothetical protein